MTDLALHGLAGTLELPAVTQGPVPVVLLLTGSGPIDRDSNHRRMRLDVTGQLARRLAEGGIASYRFDKHGVGGSPGDWRTHGLWDNVDDAAAVLAQLRERPEVDSAGIFVVGHSEGAIQAVALAARDHDLGGVGLLAPSARSGEQMLRWQARTLIPTLPRAVRALLRVLPGDPVAKVERNHQKLKATTADVTRMGLAKVNAKWFREFLAYDPAVDLPDVRCPVLAITGDKDLQVDPADLAVVASLAGGSVETHLVPDLTHTLRRQPGAPSMSRYKHEVRQPVDAEVVETVAAWIRRHA